MYQLYLFIFESIGTSELFLIGVVALMFLGPRKLPEMAKKIGKIMADFRNTTSEFKETWEREVNFDEEVKSLNLNDLQATPISRVTPPAEIETTESATAPAIREIDPINFNNPLAPSRNSEPETTTMDTSEPQLNEPADELKDKKNWL